MLDYEILLLLNHCLPSLNFYSSVLVWFTGNRKIMSGLSISGLDRTLEVIYIVRFPTQFRCTVARFANAKIGHPIKLELQINNTL